MEGNFGHHCIPGGYLSDYPQLQTGTFFGSSHVKLSEVDEDIGHTFVHFLYTGTYETLSPRPCSDIHVVPREFERSVQVYRAAKTYGVHGLEELAKKYIEKLGE